MSEEALQPFALNYELIGPMQRVVAKLNFEGKLQAVSEDPAVHTQRLSFGDWTASRLLRHAAVWQLDAAEGKRSTQVAAQWSRS